MPIDLGGTESSGLTGMAWHRLAGHLGIEKGQGPDVLEPFQQVVRVGPELRERFAIDTLALFPEPTGWKPGTLGDGSVCRVPAGWNEEVEPGGSRVVLGSDGRPAARMPAGGFYFDPVGQPLAACESAADLEKHRAEVESFDLPGFCDEGIEATAARARELHAGTESAVVFNLCCHFLAGGTILRGYEQFMIDLLTEPELVDALMEMLLDAYLRRAEAYAPALAESVDVVLFNDDLGTQNGPIIAPDLYRKFVKPRQAKLFGRARELFGAPIVFHSCGAVSEFIADLAEVGVDALNPVQVGAADMDSARLKREFGKDICFWGGGCDTQRVLVSGTPEDVREEVRKRIGDLAPGGGFVFTQVHNVQPDVPPENLVAMLEAAREFGA
ncbi:MAG: uroporphyrinogen decarboxylase family protein, partial [Planctomycetota bacterium]